MATTGYRFLRYHSGGRADRKKGPPVLRLRARGPMVIASTMIVSLSGIVLLLEGPNARGDLLLIHKARFVLWLTVAALHIVGQLGHLARSASARAETERVARARGRMVPSRPGACRRARGRRVRDSGLRSPDLAWARLTPRRPLTGARPTATAPGDCDGARANAQRRATEARAPLRRRLARLDVRHLGLRARLTVALALILTAAMAGAFAAVYRETGSRVRAQIDHDLARDTAALTRALSSASAAPTAVEAAARRYLDDQPVIRKLGAPVRHSGAAVARRSPTSPSCSASRPEPASTATLPQVQQREQAQAHAILSARSGHHVLDADRFRSCPTIGRVCRVRTPRDRDCGDWRAMGRRGPSSGERATRVSTRRRAGAAGSDRRSPPRRTLDLAPGPGDCRHGRQDRRG